MAAGGKTAAVSVPGPSSVASSAIVVSGRFPLESETGVIAESGGRSSPGDGSPDPDLLSVSMYIQAKRLGGRFEPGEASSSGREGPTDGWPASWTLITNDSNNVGAQYDDLDIRHFSMQDNSNYIFFNISLDNMTNLHVNDEWNCYFQTNSNSTNTSQNMWYRVSLRCVNSTAPYFNATLSSYTGSASPPVRGDTWTTNETLATKGNTSDGTAFGYWYDKTNNSVLFYVSKSQLWGNLLGPGNTTNVYSDTWYTNRRGNWNRVDRAPNNNTSSYTMVPEFGDLLAPAAGVIVIHFAVARGRRGRRACRVSGRGSGSLGRSPRASGWGRGGA
jgi:hypothetical protein